MFAHWHPLRISNLGKPPNVKEGLVHLGTIIRTIGRDMNAREPWNTLITSHEVRNSGYQFQDEVTVTTISKPVHAAHDWRLCILVHTYSHVHMCQCFRVQVILKMRHIHIRVLLLCPFSQ